LPLSKGDTISLVECLASVDLLMFKKIEWMLRGGGVVSMKLSLNNDNLSARYRPYDDYVSHSSSGSCPGSAIQ